MYRDLFDDTFDWRTVSDESANPRYVRAVLEQVKEICTFAAQEGILNKSGIVYNPVAYEQAVLDHKKYLHEKAGQLAKIAQ